MSDERFSPHDITSREFWGQTFDARDRTFAELRATPGLSWHPPVPSVFDGTEPGFWALTRRADIVQASLHPELFSSANGIALDPMPAELQRIATFFLMMDPPQHTLYRRLISSAFTPVMSPRSRNRSARTPPRSSTNSWVPVRWTSSPPVRPGCR